MRFIRTELGYTQERLAMEAGVDVRQIRRYESGKQCPTIVHMEAMLRVLEIPIWQLLDMDRETAEKYFGLKQDVLVPPTVEMRVLLQAISDRFANMEQQLHRELRILDIVIRAVALSHRARSIGVDRRHNL